MWLVEIEKIDEHFIKEQCYGRLSNTLISIGARKKICFTLVAMQSFELNYYRPLVSIP